MKKSPRSEKALRPNAGATAMRDSFHDIQPRIGYGTANVAAGGGYSPDYLSRNPRRAQNASCGRRKWDNWRGNKAIGITPAQGCRFPAGSEIRRIKADVKASFAELSAKIRSANPSLPSTLGNARHRIN